MKNGKASIFRYDPRTDTKPYYQQFTFRFEPGMTVLDVLNQLYEEQDTTLAYIYCCRNGHCGICGARVNEKPGLLCREAAVAELTIAPLENFAVKKDLIIDREEYENKLLKLRCFLERQSKPSQEPEVISAAEIESFIIASRCVECYCCVSVCPEYKKNPHLFSGPAAFTLEARHFFDPRDELNRYLLLQSAGIDRCIECGMCSRLCPQQADPLGLIRKMKKKIEGAVLLIPTKD